MFKAIGKGFSALFGRSESADALIDAAVRTGDALVFTDEEQSQANMMLLKLKIEYAKATTGSRLARRVLAIAVTGIYLFWFSVACVLTIAGANFDVVLADGQVIQSAPAIAAGRLSELLTSLAVGGAFVTIISWYFVAGINRTNGSKA